jgi:hypothetical protein
VTGAAAAAAAAALPAPAVASSSGDDFWDVPFAGHFAAPTGAPAVASSSSFDFGLVPATVPVPDPDPAPATAPAPAISLSWQMCRLAGADGGVTWRKFEAFSLEMDACNSVLLASTAAVLELFGADDLMRDVLATRLVLEFLNKKCMDNQAIWILISNKMSLFIRRNKAKCPAFDECFAKVSALFCF